MKLSNRAPGYRLPQPAVAICVLFSALAASSGQLAEPVRTEASRGSKSPPCFGTTWNLVGNDTIVANTLSGLAKRMYQLADSANRVVANRYSDGYDVTSEFFTSAAEVSWRAAAIAPDHYGTALLASRLTLRAASLGEARVDTVLGLRAECYAKRAMELARPLGSLKTQEARGWLDDVQAVLDDERRASIAGPMPRR